MKLIELARPNIGGTVVEPAEGGGYEDTTQPEKGRLSTYLLRRKSEKNNPKVGDDTAPDNKTDGDTGDDPDGSTGL